MEIVYIRYRGFKPPKREGKEENKKLVTFTLQPVFDLIGSSVLDSLYTKKKKNAEMMV